MKYIFALVWWCGWLFPLAAQTVQFSGCGQVLTNNYHGQTLYVIQDHNKTKPFGKIIFTPAEGGQSWQFTWTYNGVPQPVSAENDSVRLEIDIPGDGQYSFRAEREGEVSASAPSFHVFFDHVPEFSVRLTDIYNCKAVSIAEITDFKIPVYEYPGEQPFEGDKSHIYYLVSDKTVPREFPDYEYAFKAKEEAVAVSDEDMSITVTITDKFGFEWTSTEAKYTSVIPKAEAELELLNTVDIVGEVNEEMGQAPLEVVFHNNSVNASSYEWLLYKDTADMDIPVPALVDSLLGEQVRTQQEFSYTYEHSGRYKVLLIAVNGQGNHCQDTTDAYYVNVVESLVDVPNVFTPNGDGKNDVFMVKAFSVENFQGIILNRWGRRVYEWSDPAGGWDGRINGKYANPGTYYYIITARGLEKRNPPKYVKKGALMLIR